VSTAQLTLERLQAAVVEHWANNFTETANVLYPGGQLDTHGANEWVELQVERAGAGPERDACAVRVAVHCWAKFGTNQARAAELADAAAAVLAGARITMKDFEASGQPVVGHLRLFGATMEDRSRGDQDRKATGAGHWVVRVEGVGHG
jgi:hypothetical protein